MAATRDEARTAVATAVAAAIAVADASDAGLYLTRQALEAAIAGARALLAAAITAANEAWAVEAVPLVRRLREVAARLLDLDRSLAEALRTTTLVLPTERGILDLAVEHYTDAEEATVLVWAQRLLHLNPQLPNPMRIPAGTQVVVYVR